MPIGYEGLSLWLKISSGNLSVYVRMESSGHDWIKCYLLCIVVVVGISMNSAPAI